MTDKQPRFNDDDECTCEWCEGNGTYEIELPDGTTKQQECDRCKGTGWARLDLTDVLARTRGEA